METQEITQYCDEAMACLVASREIMRQIQRGSDNLLVPILIRDIESVCRSLQSFALGLTSDGGRAA